MPDKRDGSPQSQNGGRPLGAATRLTRARANEIVASGKSPLDVMIKNMSFWEEQAQALADTLTTHVGLENKQGQQNKALRLVEGLLSACEHA